MKSIIFILSGMLSGYVIANLNTKPIEEIIEDLLLKIDSWLEEIQKFIGKTVSEIEGADSETMKLNINSFIDSLIESTEEFLELENFNEKVRFIENKFSSVSKKLTSQTVKLNKGSIRK